MPYIEQARRNDLATSPYCAETPGELNYVITAIALDYLFKRMQRSGQTKVSYGLLQEVHGVLGGAQAEFYRRAMAPYEDAKIISNGDVYYPPILTPKGNH